MESGSGRHRPEFHSRRRSDEVEDQVVVIQEIVDVELDPRIDAAPMVFHLKE